MDPTAEILELVAATRAQVERDRAYLQQLWRRLAETDFVIRESALALHQSGARLVELATGDRAVTRTSRPP